MLSLQIAVVAIVSACVSATPVPAAQEIAVASVGRCSQDCWNESVAVAGCDPNADDDCLCGPFFDAVTSCAAQTCSMGENLQVFDNLEPFC